MVRIVSAHDETIAVQATRVKALIIGVRPRKLDGRSIAVGLSGPSAPRQRGRANIVRRSRDRKYTKMYPP
jgi:hypothetical protein